MSRLRFLTAGESHGPALSLIIEGVPAGLPLLAETINVDLGRRQKGYGRGGRMKIETDRVEIMSGIRHGETLGSPIALRIENRDFASWTDRMSPAPNDKPGEPLTRPRPGHADLAGGQKYDRDDLRDILERASARETAARTAVGAVAKALLQSAGIDVFGHVVSIGSVIAAPFAGDRAAQKTTARESDLACADSEAAARMRTLIHETSHQGDTLGGVFEVVATGMFPGLGSHVQWDRKLDGRLAQGLMSLQAIKGVEMGDGFAAAQRSGSTVHDAIEFDQKSGRFPRTTNRAGGVEGGMSNGEDLVCRAAMKPIATLKKALRSVDLRTLEAVDAAFERSDICAVAAASVVGEAIVAWVLAEALLEKFGSDSIRELTRNLEGYRAQLRDFATI